MTLKDFLKSTAKRFGLSETQLKWALSAYRKNIIGYGAIAKMLSHLANSNISGNQVRKVFKKLTKYNDWIL